jgi:saccharopine dehydrogenase (NAD+, L-lysine-forming)
LRAPALWLRREAALHERRTVLVPADAAKLVADGVQVTVELAEQRAFPIEEYAAAGCRVVPGDTWPDAAPEEYILGLKEPSPAAHELRHRHIFFGHAFKGQSGGQALLDRITAGEGTLLDLEALVDEGSRRVVAFGFWAGYVGAALAVLHQRGELWPPLRSMTRTELDGLLRAGGHGERALVVGALGRSGRGASAALTVAGADVTQWDVAETRQLDSEAVLGHDILVNAIFSTEPGEPILNHDALGRRDRTLTTVSDVTCDVTSACNRLPVNDTVTTWAAPARRLTDGPPPLDILAIDNLPSLVPRESSAAFSSELVPHLRVLGEQAPIWRRCEQQFCDALTRLGQMK